MTDLRSQNKFQRLKVWEKSHHFVLAIYRATKTFPNIEKYALIDQIRRSASSVPTNIVEGNERQTKKEFIQFLYTAKGSLAETQYHLLLAKDLEYMSPSTYESIDNQAREIGKMINSLITYLRSKI